MGQSLPLKPRTARKKVENMSSSDELDTKDVLIWIALISTALPTLYGSEWKFEIGIGSIYVADVLLFLAVLMATKRIRSTPYVGLFSLAVVIFCFVGIWNEASISWVIRDSRPALYILAGMVIGAYIMDRPGSVRFGIRALTWLIGVTTILAILSQITSTTIVGSDLGAVNAVYYAGETIYLESRRIQTETVSITLFVVCFLFAAWIFKVRIGHVVGRRHLTVLILASTILTVLSYSRNSLAGLIFTGAFAALVSFPSSRLDRIGRMLFLAAVALIFVGIPTWIGYQYGLFVNVVDTFSGRVLAGIAPDVIGTDPSVGWRFIETTAAFEYVAHNPISGTGFGAFYRERILGEPFEADQGRVYLHNYLLLVFVKFGLLGGTLMLGLILSSIYRMLRAANSAQFANLRLWAPVAAAFAAMMVVSSVSPVMYSRSFAAFGGCLIACGLILGKSHVNRRAQL